MYTSFVLLLAGHFVSSQMRRQVSAQTRTECAWNGEGQAGYRNMRMYMCNVHLSVVESSTTETVGTSLQKETIERFIYFYAGFGCGILHS